MAKAPPKPSSKKTAPEGRSSPPLGLATTTQVAFVADGKLFMERMSVLSEEGAGVLCADPPKVGATLQLAFRLSTAEGTVRCMAEVVGDIPTTPSGMILKEKLGARALPAIMSAGLSDSATAVFRMEDLKAAQEAPAERDDAARADRNLPSGFSVRFTKLTKSGKAALAHHLSVSRRLSDQLAARQDRLVSIGDNDRKIGDLFNEGDLSKRALDW